MASAQYRCGGGVATRQRLPEARSDLHCPVPACGLFSSLEGRGLVSIPIVEWSLDCMTIQNLNGLSDCWETCGDDTLHGVVSLLTVVVEQNPFYTPQYSSF
jgi:hypothetical protein